MQARLSMIVLAAFLASPAGAATRNFGIGSGFDRIRVDGPYKVSLTTGVAPSASATGSQAALDRVAIDVQGRTLIVRPSQSSWGGYPGDDPGPVQINISTHELGQAWLNGAGSLRIDRVKALSFELNAQGSGMIGIDHADVDQLKVGISGTAAATLGGTAGKLTAFMRGATSLDASSMTIKDAALNADGAATIKARITNSATVNGSGPATITIAGGPACTLRLAGSATVTGCVDKSQ